MSNHPLAEVFGFPTDNMSDDARRHREDRLCPFHNKVPNCTKDRAEDPLGVCSIFTNDDPTITCPVRFREDWEIATDAADFFFPQGTRWTSLTEVRLPDKYGKSAGNIDIVLVAYDDQGRIIDYGAVEVQAVYISGNIRTPFQYYMDDPTGRCDMDWHGHRNYPRPDYLSSSRKRLAPQLIFKGGILHAWQRKTAVVLDTLFYETLPTLDEVSADEAEIAWILYELSRDQVTNRYRLTKTRTIYTLFEPSLLKVTRSEAGDEAAFIRRLQTSLDQKTGASAADLTEPDMLTPPDIGSTIAEPF